MNKSLLDNTKLSQSYSSFSDTNYTLNHRKTCSCTHSTNQSEEEEEEEQEEQDEEYETYRGRRSSVSSSLETLNEQSTSKMHDNAKLDFLGTFPSSLYIENRASVARDHMANERTYLAWVRTSLSTISIGVAVTQLFRIDKSVFNDPEAVEQLQGIGKPLGVVFIIIGMFYLLFACIRYFHSQNALVKGYFPASRGIVILASASIFIALVSVFIVINQRH